MRRDPILQGGLHQRFAGELLLFRLQRYAQLVNQIVKLGAIVVHAGLNNGLDGVIHKLDKATLAGGGAGVLLGPLLGGRVEKVVSPQLLHHLLLLQITCCLMPDSQKQRSS